MQIKHIYESLRWNYTSKKDMPIVKTAFTNLFGL